MKLTQECGQRWYRWYSWRKWDQKRKKYVLRAKFRKLKLNDGKWIGIAFGPIMLIWRTYA